jgi:NAD(P)-dependent dehydrogenase (short-subunit alcohol dehydrogenase family)
LYGNFGQSNYSAAKMGLVGLMQTLALEGAKYDIRVNALAPTAATRMTEGLYPEQMLNAIQASDVVPAMLVLAHKDAPTRQILCAGAGSFEAAHISLTQGVFLGRGDDVDQALQAQLAIVNQTQDSQIPANGMAQGMLELGRAMGQQK